MPLPVLKMGLPAGGTGVGSFNLITPARSMETNRVSSSRSKKAGKVFNLSSVVAHLYFNVEVGV